VKGLQKFWPDPKPPNVEAWAFPRYEKGEITISKQREGQFENLIEIEKRNRKR